MSCLAGRDFEAEVLMKKTQGRRRIAFELMSTEKSPWLVGIGLEWLLAVRRNRISKLV